MNAVTANFLVENVGAGALAPALAAAAILWASRRVGERATARRVLAAIALPLGFLVGYVLLPWAPLRPEQPWHWLAAVAVVSGVAGAIGAAAGPGRIGTVLRWVVTAVAAALAAWLILPDWAEWQDNRLIVTTVLTLGMVGLVVGIRPLMERSSTVSWPLLLLTIATIAGAVILGLSQNLKLAQLAGVLAASLGGCVLVSCWRGGASMADATLSWVLLLGGLMFLGRAYSFSAVPIVSYVLVPCAPLGLWLCELALPATCRGPRRMACQALAVALPLAVALGFALAADLAIAG